MAYQNELPLQGGSGKSVARMVEEFAVTAKQEKNPRMARELVFEEFKEWVDEALDEEDYSKEREAKELGDILYEILTPSSLKFFTGRISSRAVSINISDWT